MTNEQLYLVIGIPGLLALVGILTNALLYTSLNSRMTALGNRMTALENRIETRMAALEARIEARMATLEGRMVSFENTFTTRFDLLMGRLTDLEKDVHRGE